MEVPGRDAAEGEPPIAKAGAQPGRCSEGWREQLPYPRVHPRPRSPRV